MTAITEIQTYTINGLIDTSRPVLENMERITNNCGSWLTYDYSTGKWSVVINQTETSSASFDDSNIIGSISINGTSLTDLYNSVEVQYPSRDINDQGDFIRVEIPAADRNDYEPDNSLVFNLDLLNDQIQAEALGLIELKQSRVDLVISFLTDFTNYDLRAGDVIDVTNSQLSFSTKLFRIVSINEVEQSGSIVQEITALEYDANVYDFGDLERFTRTNENGIITKGAIGIPSTPQITRIENDPRPRLIVEATVPTGIVEGMEIWYSTDNSTFSLLGTEKASGGGVYTSGSTLTFDFDWASSGNVYIQSRGINSTTTGPFSVTAADTFTPVQTTQAINGNTDVVDENDNNSSLLNLLGANALLALLRGLMEDGETGNNSFTGQESVFKQIFDVFETETGVNPYTEATNGTLSYFVFNTSPGTITYSASNILTSSESNRPFDSYVDERGYGTFTCPQSGNYLITVFINGAFDVNDYNFDASDSFFRSVEMELSENDINGTIVATDNTSSILDPFDDLTLSKVVNLPAGNYYMYLINSCEKRSVWASIPGFQPTITVQKIL